MIVFSREFNNKVEVYNLQNCSIDFSLSEECLSPRVTIPFATLTRRKLDTA